ncbi:keratinocyte-associated protein 3 isoform X1 [Passer montanus]|uniref:keratinocyte-associated protein 3 isoform X1 n=1 Tax=Passer montanus TaxID=9160 RepID=UPI0019605CB3|nr:keratinocyte-associated protein 3 isoform X1 [Passer montanus]
MRSGLGLIVLGHGSLVLGAIVHGSVLRHVAGARRAVTPEYAAANVVSVCSGLLSIAAGIVAILVSHNLSRAVLVSAGLRAGGLGAALPRRQPLPWTLAPRLLPPRRRLPALRVSPVPGSAPPALREGGSAVLGQKRFGGRSCSRVGGLAWARSVGGHGAGCAGLGWGLPRSLLSTEPEARGVQRGPAHGGWKDAKGARASSEGVSEPSWKRREVVCAPRGSSSAETQVPCPSVSRAPASPTRILAACSTGPCWASLC